MSSQPQCVVRGAQPGYSSLCSVRTASVEFEICGLAMGRRLEVVLPWSAAVVDTARTADRRRVRSCIVDVHVGASII